MKMTMSKKQVSMVLLCAIGVLFMAADIRASVVLDLRPEVSNAANPGNGSTRINVTAGSSDYPINPLEVATPLIDNVNGRSTLAQGQNWGGTGLNIDGSMITFTVTELVDYDGLTANGAIFRADANGLGMGIDSTSSSEAWYVLDGQESFTWTASEAMQWEGFTLRSFGSNGTRILKVSSTDWVGLSGVTPGTGVTFDASTGTFTIANITDNVAADGLTLDELVGVGGPTLDFTSIKIANAGTVGTAIQTITLGGEGTPPDPVLSAIPDTYTLYLDAASTLSVTAPGILANDVYNGSHPVSALPVNTTSNGTLSLSANGSFTYEPNPGFTGTEGFTYKAYTSAITSEVAQVSITVIEPVVPVETALPFTETFDLLTDGTLDEQNGWAVQGGSAVVQSSVVQNGSKAAELTNTSVSRELSSSNSMLWATFWAYCDGAADNIPAVTDEDASVVFYINTNLHLVAYSNTVPLTLETVIPTNVWTRFDVYCDYDNMTWDLSVNKANVAAGLSLYSTNRYLASLLIQNGSASPVYMDEFSIVDQEPVTDMIDGDGDSMPDWWEHKYFGGITNAAPVATNLNTYIAGLKPGETFELWGGPLGWEGQPGRRYAVYATSNLLDGFSFQTNILWSESQYTDLIHTNEQAMFYRVEVELDQ